MKFHWHTGVSLSQMHVTEIHKTSKPYVQISQVSFKNNRQKEFKTSWHTYKLNQY